MLIQTTTILFALFVMSSSQQNDVVIKLELIDSCVTAAEFDWLIFSSEADTPVTNCSVRYSHAKDFNTSHAKERPYPLMEHMGSFTVQGLDSLAGRQFSVQLRCGDSYSDIITFVVNDTNPCSETDDKTNTDGPIMFQDESSILGSRDSLLGVLFGLFGFLIIAITTFYVVKKIRRRNRLERIRRYLGSTLIDPFENLQNRIDSDRDTGSEQLIRSTDGLFQHRTTGENTELG